jgi:putative ABC transport system substrate-binding protein
MIARMHRRSFITLLGGAAAAWPVVARAQQPAMPVIGFLYGGRPAENLRGVAAFRQGLADAGFIVDQNVAIEYRWANLDFAKLPSFAADLVARQVAVIFAASSLGPLRAAKAATGTIPIVFFYGGDPVLDGLVASLNRPAGNVTGVTGLTSELAAKRLGLLHEMVPRAKKVAFLTTDPNDRANATGILAGARTLGLELIIFWARGGADDRLERAFAVFVERHADALILDNNARLADNATKIVALAERHKLPAMYFGSGFVRAGGLMSYSAENAGYRLAAAQYVAPILKGTKPADLPVQQPTKFQLVINLNTAKALGLAVPVTLITIADEVIE